MAITFDSVGSIIEASDLRSRLDTIEEFVNFLIDDASSDFNLSDTNKLETKHIYKPDLFGSPSPRSTGVSNQVHWRNVANDWTNGVYFSSSTAGGVRVPVPGLCTRIKLTKRCDVSFMSSFYAFEIGGMSKAKAHWKYRTVTLDLDSLPWDDPYERTAFGHNGHIAADVVLVIDGTEYNTTNRKIYTSAVEPVDDEGKITNASYLMHSMISRRQYSICKTVSLSAGIHDIGITCQPRAVDSLDLEGKAREHGDNAEVHEHAHIYFLARSMVCDAIYKD